MSPTVRFNSGVVFCHEYQPVHALKQLFSLGLSEPLSLTSTHTLSLSLSMSLPERAPKQKYLCERRSVFLSSYSIGLNEGRWTKSFVQRNKIQDLINFFSSTSATGKQKLSLFIVAEVFLNSSLFVWVISLLLLLLLLLVNFNLIWTDDNRKITTSRSRKFFAWVASFDHCAALWPLLRFDRLTARRIETNADSIEISNLRFRPDLLVSGHLGGVPL